MNSHIGSEKYRTPKIALAGVGVGFLLILASIISAEVYSEQIVMSMPAFFCMQGFIGGVLLIVCCLALPKIMATPKHEIAPLEKDEENNTPLLEVTTTPE
jgi:hypothetical protein